MATYRSCSVLAISAFCWLTTQTNFGTQFAITGFVWKIVTRRLHMEGVWVVGRQNADIANSVQLRDVAMATIFNCFVWTTATRQLVTEGVWVIQNADIADTLHLRDVSMATFLAFCISGAHWRQLANTTESSMCGGNTALGQINLTTCYYPFSALTLLVEHQEEHPACKKIKWWGAGVVIH